MKKRVLIVSFALVLLAVFATAWTPEPWREHVLNVSELLGTLIAIVGVPTLLIQLRQLKGGLLTASEARELIESDLKQKESELKKHMLCWFPEDGSREPGDFEVKILLDPEAELDWLQVVEDWLPQREFKRQDWPREGKNYCYFDLKKQKRDAIRARWGKAWVVCFSASSRRFTNKDAETLGNNLKSSDISVVLGDFDMHGKMHAKFSDHQRVKGETQLTTP